MSYLSTIAQAAYGAGTLRAATWLERQQQTLRQHSPEHVLAAVRDILAQGTAQGLDAARRDIIAGSLAYRDKRVEQMRYAQFRAAGYPIGSGIVESAHQTEVHARLKGAGMFWARAQVNPMLSVRGIDGNDRWAEAWPALTAQLRAQRANQARQRRLARQPPVPAVSAAPAPAPTASIVPPRPPSAVPRPRPARPRRPAADHPWRHMTIGRPRSA